MSKVVARKRRSAKTKAVIRQNGRARLVVHKTISNTYAQIIVPGNQNGNQSDEVVVSSSTLDKELQGIKGTKTEKASQVGKLLAERAKKKKVTLVAFDRAGYKYHGRVKALADAAREAGLDF